jgi:serine/threonine protein kinase
VARLTGTVWAGRHELLLLEVAPGENLVGRTLDVPQAARVCAQLAATLEGLHRRGIVYLDVKPKNVLWDGQRATLVDCGMARRLGGEQSVATLPPSPECVPPEVALTFRAGAAADVFQLGLLFARLTTGRHPFDRVDFDDDEEHRESQLIRYALPALCCEPALPFSGTLAAMLRRESSRRPSLAEVTAAFEEAAR